MRVASVFAIGLIAFSVFTLATATRDRDEYLVRTGRGDSLWRT